MKVWISKYALTDGIQEVEAELCGKEYPGMIKVLTDGKSSPRYFYGGDGRNWHSNRQSAVITATVMRDRKVASLEKQIIKLNALTFKEK